MNNHDTSRPTAPGQSKPLFLSCSSHSEVLVPRYVAIQVNAEMVEALKSLVAVAQSHALLKVQFMPRDGFSYRTDLEHGRLASRGQECWTLSRDGDFWIHADIGDGVDIVSISIPLEDIEGFLDSPSPVALYNGTLDDAGFHSEVMETIDKDQNWSVEVRAAVLNGWMTLDPGSAGDYLTERAEDLDRRVAAEVQR